MKAGMKTIDIFRISHVRNSLLEDLTMTAPDDLSVVGCELDGRERITYWLSRSNPPNASMRREIREPPRGVFDLKDFGLGVFIQCRYPHPLFLLDVMAYDQFEGRSALIPVRATAQDLVAARKIAATSMFACSRAALVMLNAGEPDDQYSEQFTALGPVAPTRFGFRETPPWPPLPAGPVTISDMASKEGEAMWSWLAGFINIPST
jgi:hypothetical protein